MLRHTSALCLMLLATTACTQPAAMVEYKGDHTYAQNNMNGYVSPNAGTNTLNAKSTYTPAPVYANSYRTTSGTSESHAHVGSIGVSDLAPPAKTAAVTKPAPELAPAAGPVKTAAKPNINPWTRTSRDAEPVDEAFNIQPQSKSVSSAKEPMVSEMKTEEKQTAALDSIIESEASKPAKVVADKPVKAASSGYIWPVNSKKIVSQYGPKGKGKINDGINIASPQGEPVWATADGEVVYSGNELKGYGNMVLIKHSGGKTSTYAHMSRINVDKYDRVKQGDIIGYVGNTGNVKSPQLHFAIRDGQDPVDPMKYLKRNVASAQ